ncbi:MAG: aminoacyl-tRNA hydrolase [Prevotella sp.]|nr:aminoacyl-tRNA hydrolase [Staphylococcus sp.]MCM1350863.1 aminoacyl-tRNA hydrolase [Prevotella sp.]
MIIVGLGNIGKSYEGTHHNAGFMALDQIALANQFSFLQEKKFQAYVAEYVYQGQKHYFIKPMTYMNNSGISVKAIMEYYHQTPEDIFVIYDDLDLSLGRIRIRKNGSAGGHNGIKSIISHLGTSEFARLRIGIQKQKEVDTIDYVLSKFSKKELSVLQPTLEKMPQIVDDLLNYGMDYIMNHYNG